MQLIATPIDHYINGRMMANTSGRTQDVTNPATGSVTGIAGLAGAAEVNAAVAAAQAAFLTVTHGRPGVYNIADEDRTVSIDKARREFGFDPAFRLPA